MEKERKGKNCVLFGSVHGTCNIAKRIFLPFTFLFVLEFNFLLFFFSFILLRASYEKVNKLRNKRRKLVERLETEVFMISSTQCV